MTEIGTEAIYIATQTLSLTRTYILSLKACVSQAILIQVAFNHSVSQGAQLRTKYTPVKILPLCLRHLLTDGSMGKEGDKQNFKRFQPPACRPGCTQLLHYQAEFKLAVKFEILIRNFVMLQFQMTCKKHPRKEHTNSCH